MTDIPIIFECQVADSWRHKFGLWRHWGDTVSSIGTIIYSTEMHQNIILYAALNGEHAGQGSMLLRSIILEIWTRETKKSWNFRIFDLWPVITGSNIDLGSKITSPIASTRREQSAVFFREALRRFVWKRQVVAPTPPSPLTPGKVAKHGLRARVKDGSNDLKATARVERNTPVCLQ